MAKGQMRGNRELKKPKQQKAPAPVPTGFAQGMNTPAPGTTKKRT